MIVNDEWKKVKKAILTDVSPSELLRYETVFLYAFSLGVSHLRQEASRLFIETSKLRIDLEERKQRKN